MLLSRAANPPGGLHHAAVQPGAHALPRTQPSRLQQQTATTRAAATANAADMQPAQLAEAAATSSSSSSSSRRRRGVLLAGLASAVAAAAASPPAGAADIEALEAEAFAAYANRDFAAASDSLAAIIAVEPDNARYHEMQAQVLTDSKQFQAALTSYNKAIGLAPAGQPVVAARLLAGRALAYEGLSAWQAALDDYDRALELAAQGKESPDPYIINARGNCHNSLHDWAAAREDYLTSSQLFQQAKGFRGRGGSTTQRLDGAIFAASNAALMLAQLGEEQGALAEFERISRRAPGSSDARAALAALYWRAGRLEQAEAVWEYACDSITSGCRKFTDAAWLTTVRRWPPVMVAYLADFLALRQDAGGSESSSSEGSGGSRTPGRLRTLAG